MRLHLLCVSMIVIGISYLASPSHAHAEKDPHGILAKRVGLWKATVNVKIPKAMTFEGEEKIGWTLNHNYLMGKGFYDEKLDGKKTEVINLMTYNPLDKRYYIWEFKAAEQVQPVPTVGTWDADKEEMVLSADYGKLGSGTGTWKFEKDGSFIWTYEMKDEKGNVFFSMEGKQVKIKANKSSKDKTK